ncbi:MAG: polysaccharide deacetylase family protein [Pseudohongiellaceae bacterium]
MNNKPKAPISLKCSVLLLAKYSGLFALARILTARKTRILAYHGIWLGRSHFGNFLYMSADKFAARMALLDKWRYPVVPLADLSSNKRRRCATVITIDDGWYSTWAAMLPALERHNYQATVYLTTYYCLKQVPVIDVALSYCFRTVDTDKGSTLHLPEYDFGHVRIDTDAARHVALKSAQDICASLDDDRARQRFLKAVCEETGIDHEEFAAGRWFHLMNSVEVRDAATRGITFEAHTHHHGVTHRGQDSLAEEISTNSEWIRELTGKAPEHFCYPSGRYSLDLWPVLDKCHMASATTTNTGLVSKRTPRYAMPRIMDGQDVSELEFEAEMSGFMELLRVARGVSKGAG